DALFDDFASWLVSTGYAQRAASGHVRRLKQALERMRSTPLTQEVSILVSFVSKAFGSCRAQARVHAARVRVLSYRARQTHPSPRLEPVRAIPQRLSSTFIGGARSGGCRRICRPSAATNCSTSRADRSSRDASGNRACARKRFVVAIC